MGNGRGGCCCRESEDSCNGGVSLVVQDKSVVSIDLETDEITCEGLGIGCKEGAIGIARSDGIVCTLDQGNGAAGIGSRQEAKSGSFSRLGDAYYIVGSTGREVSSSLGQVA